MNTVKAPMHVLCPVFHVLVLISAQVTLGAALQLADTTGWRTSAVLVVLLWVTISLMQANHTIRTVRTFLTERLQFAERRATNTGMWKGRGRFGRPIWFTVRWDPASEVYFVMGTIHLGTGFDWSSSVETEWPNIDSLADAVDHAETTGIRPSADVVTQTIRCRLDIPGWDGTDPAEARRIRALLSAWSEQ